MIKTAIYFIILIHTSLHAQIQFQNSGVDGTLRDVCFKDSLRGWAIGDNSTIIATLDGGDHWVKQSCPVDSIILERVYFTNKSVGYIVGQQGTILSTKDGGETWIENESPVNYGLWDLCFINSDTGWIAGGDVLQSRKHGIILYTKDGGKNWIKQYFYDIEFYDENNGLAIASDYIDNFSLTNIYRTSDGGLSWYIIGDIGTPLYRMVLTSIDTVWAGGYTFVRSFDGGLNWDWNYNINAIVTDIDQFDNYTGCVSAGGELYITTTSGEEWSTLVNSDSIQITATSGIDINTFWAVGYSGLVIKYKLIVSHKI